MYLPCMMNTFSSNFTKLVTQSTCCLATMADQGAFWVVQHWPSKAHMGHFYQLLPSRNRLLNNFIPQQVIIHSLLLKGPLVTRKKRQNHTCSIPRKNCNIASRELKFSVMLKDHLYYENKVTYKQYKKERSRKELKQL